MFESFGVVEMVVTGFVCFLLSFAVVAIMIQTFSKKKKKGNREKESLLSSSRSTKRFQKRIKIQKTSNVPTQHLRSLSAEFLESPMKQSNYKYPRQHYRRKSTPNMIYIPKNKNKSTLINIYPNFKCEKLFSLHQIQPMTSSTSTSSLTTPSSTTTSTAAATPVFTNRKSSGSSSSTDKGNNPGGGGETNHIKSKHLYLPESKGYYTEYFTKQLNHNNNNNNIHYNTRSGGLRLDLKSEKMDNGFEKKLYFTREK